MPVRFCPGCGKPQQPSNVFCPECGRNLRHHEEGKPAAPEVSPPPPSPPPALAQSSPATAPFDAPTIVLPSQPRRAAEPAHPDIAVDPLTPNRWVVRRTADDGAAPGGAQKPLPAGKSFEELFPPELMSQLREQEEAINRKTKRQTLVGCGLMIGLLVLALYLITLYANPAAPPSAEDPKSKEFRSRIQAIEEEIKAREAARHRKEPE